MRRLTTDDILPKATRFGNRLPVVRWWLPVCLVVAVLIFIPTETVAESVENSGSTYDLANLPWRLKRAMFEAAEQRDEHRYDQAAAVFNRLLLEHPESDHVLLRVYLGNDLMMADSIDAALGHYQAGAALDSHYAAAWLGVGNAAYETGEFVRSAEAFSRARRCGHQNSPQVIYYIAAAWVMAERHQLAIPYLDELVSGQIAPPELDWFRLLLTIQQELGLTSEAESTIVQMISLFEDDPDCWQLIYQYAAVAGDYERSAVAKTITGYLRPLSRQETISLGDLYLSIGAASRACDYYAEALGDSANADEYERYASAALAARDGGKVEEILRLALSNEPTARLWSLLGDHYYLEEEFQKSYDAFAESARLDEGEGRAFLMMAYNALAIGDLDKLSACVREVDRFSEYQKQARELEKQLVQ